LLLIILSLQVAVVVKTFIRVQVVAVGFAVLLLQRVVAVL
jgi:hypothetical protein